MDDPRRILEALWQELSAGDTDEAGPRQLPPLDFVGARGQLPSPYAVAPFAEATVGLALAALSELAACRAGTAPPAVRVDRGHAAVAFRSERHIEPTSWALPPIWDPVAGDYATRDGWVRLHTNYPHHRAAVLRALDVPADRAEIAARVASLSADDVEHAVVGEGGCAAKMRTAEEWARHPQGIAVAAEPLVARELAPIEGQGARATWRRGARNVDSRVRPLEGVRVLDLTRVIAGPVCTRVLAAHGADVLRLDPPGFAEVQALLGDTTQGKRRAALDLDTDEGRATFLRLVSEADLLVCGLRSDALERRGLGVDHLREVSPALGLVLLDGYGWTGPWRARRGFDSLVQMSTGIAARSRAAGEGDERAPPGALPAQALDHGAGYLLAAVACRALTDRARAGVATVARLSLARVARLLVGLGDDHDRDEELRAPATAASADDIDRYREPADSSFGPLRRVRCPGRIAGIEPHWSRDAGALGVDPPAFGED